MNKNNLTLTIIINVTANYGESLGNLSSVQKFYKNGKTYAMRSKESLKYAIMEQSGLYEDLKVSVDGAAQKEVNIDVNISNCKALEGGYMNTSNSTHVRNSSFYLTDAVSFDEMIIDSRFHNNLNMAKTYAKANDLSVQDDASKVGLMPYQYEFDRSLKKYSITIDLDKVGKDENFDMEASNEEKSSRVCAILNAIETLNLVVKGNLDNAEPLFIVGGLSEYRTHYFENVVNVKNSSLNINDELITRINKGYDVGLIKGGIFINENEIVENLNPKIISDFFDNLRKQVKSYYGV